MKIPLPMNPRAIAALLARMDPASSLNRPPMGDRAFYQPRTGDVTIPENYLVGGREIEFLRDRTGLPLNLDETAPQNFIGKASPALADLMAGHERRHGMQYGGTPEGEPFRLADPSYLRNTEAIDALRRDLWPDPATDEMAGAKAKIMSNDEFDADVYAGAYERALGQHENRPLLPHDEMMKLALLEALATRRQIARTQYDLPYNAPPKNVLAFTRQRRLPFDEGVE